MQQLYPTRRGAFTVLELLVAMSVTVLLLFLINRLFFDTVNAVGRGAALGQILGSSRAISDQIERDANAMIGPSEGGFLVIVNKKMTGIAVLTKNGQTTRDIRSDQLIFIRRADGLEPLTPRSTNSFNNSHYAAYARVWYGHVLRTDPNGTGPAAGGLGTGLNSVATNWILGRQALLLRGSGILSTDIRVVGGAQFNDAVGGLSAIPPTLAMYMALSDVSDQSLQDLTGPGGDLDGRDESTYKNLAYNYTFAPSVAAAFSKERLRVNAVPLGITFESWRIAQMHPYFMENVSDFVVEFAIDVNPGDGVAEPKMDANGNIQWYGLGVLDALPNLFLVGYRYTVKHFPASALGPNEQRYTFRHDYPNYWPYLIRIRYRLHDRKGRFEEHVGDSSGQAESGKWFEQIIAVNRQ